MTEQPTGPAQPPFRAPQQPPYRRLTRTAWDAPVSGVCGGIAKYFGIDPTLVRVLAVIAMVFTFPVGPIVYAILWAVIPKE
jgi:phage shock protein PspC (stress-responsive transcriptional regulator)